MKGLLVQVQYQARVNTPMVKLELAASKWGREGGEEDCFITFLQTSPFQDRDFHKVGQTDKIYWLWEHDVTVTSSKAVEKMKPAIILSYSFHVCYINWWNSSWFYILEFWLILITDNHEFKEFDGAKYCGGVVVHNRWVTSNVVHYPNHFVSLQICSNRQTLYGRLSLFQR